MLYAYKSNQVQPQFDDWAGRVRRLAGEEHDAELLTLVDLLTTAYRHEAGRLPHVQRRRLGRAIWSARGPNIRMMATIEAASAAWGGQAGADASRLAAEVMGQLERKARSPGRCWPRPIRCTPTPLSPSAIRRARSTT